jgi:hypothetical protein
VFILPSDSTAVLPPACASRNSRSERASPQDDGRDEVLLWMLPLQNRYIYWMNSDNPAFSQENTPDLSVSSQYHLYIDFNG